MLLWDLSQGGVKVLTEQMSAVRLLSGYTPFCAFIGSFIKFAMTPESPGIIELGFEYIGNALVFVYMPCEASVLRDIFKSVGVVWL